MLMLACTLALGPAEARKMARVDFKYTSNSHLAPSERFVHTGAPAADVAAWLRAKANETGATILADLAGQNAALEIAPNGHACWQAGVDVAQQEWEAFEQNDFKLYERVDRSNPLIASGCSELQLGPADASGFIIKLVLPLDRSESTLIKGVYGIPFGSYEQSFTSHATFHVWPTATGSSVYAWAVPVNNGIEAAAGNSIGRDWWEATNGNIEAYTISKWLGWIRDAFAGSASAVATTPGPQPVVQPEPQPVVQPAPEPVVQPAPEPVVQPAPVVEQPAPVVEQPVMATEEVPSTEPPDEDEKSWIAKNKAWLIGVGAGGMAVCCCSCLLFFGAYY